MNAYLGIWHQQKPFNGFGYSIVQTMNASMSNVLPITDSGKTRVGISPRLI